MNLPKTQFFGKSFWSICRIKCETKSLNYYIIIWEVCLYQLLINTKRFWYRQFSTPMKYYKIIITLWLLCNPSLPKNLSNWELSSWLWREPCLMSTRNLCCPRRFRLWPAWLGTKSSCCCHYPTQVWIRK